MMKTTCLLIGWMGISLAYGQIDPSAFGYYREALRYGQTFFGGSARLQAMGGAGVALGGDMSHALLNPAGLGFYWRNEVSGSMTIALNSSQSRFLGTTTAAFRPHLHLPQFGVVFGADLDDGRGSFFGGGIAITAHRVNDFQHHVIASGINSFVGTDEFGRTYGNGFIDYLLERAQGTPRSVFDAQIGSEYDFLALAYSIYLINPLSIAGSESRYSSFVTPRPFLQRDSRLTKGSQYQYALSAGGNFSDMFYFGATLGLATLYYENDQRYSEQVITPAEMVSLEFNESFSQSGNGVNAGFGCIFRPIDAFRLGFSAYSPTLYRLSDTYNATLKVRFNNYYFLPSEHIEGDNSPGITLATQEISLFNPVVSNYSLTTPGRITMGAAFFAGKRGLLSFDAERVNYGGARLSDPDFRASLQGDNRTIATLYHSVWNLRTGAELRHKDFRYRLGYAFYPSAFRTTAARNDDRQFITAGLGYRKSQLAIDIATIVENWQTSYAPYLLAAGNEPPIVAASQRIRVIATVSYHFQ